MKTVMRWIAILSLMITGAVLYAVPSAPLPVVGVVVPLEHQAMNEIVAGFKQSLAAQYPDGVQIIVKNAQHDATMQKAILNQFAATADLVAPIGTDALQMAIATLKNKPIVGIAAEFTEQDRQRLLPRAVTNIIDEIDDDKQLQFIAAVIPQLRYFTLVYSADSKSVNEAGEVIAHAKSRGITVQPMLMQQLAELYTLSQHIDAQSQAIVILKDSLIVSGITVLVKEAEKIRKPLIASDDGSVQGGAAFAVGVKERQIGEKAGAVVAEFLHGKALTAIPVQTLTDYYVFVNQVHAQKQGVDLALLLDAARSANYTVVTSEPQ